MISFVTSSHIWKDNIVFAHSKVYEVVWTVYENVELA
jgi:hypothetical protein